INPLNNTVVGYLDTLQRATAFVYEVGPESSQIVLHEVASTVTSSDVVVARTTRWAALRPGPTLLETQVDSLYRLLCVRWHEHFATARNADQTPAHRHFEEVCDSFAQGPSAQVPPAQPQREAALSSSDISSALMTAKAIVDGASYDTARARQLKFSGDTARLVALRAVYANRLDSARAYLATTLASPDTALH